MVLRQTKTVVGTQSLLRGLQNLRSETREIMTHVICAPLVPWQPNGGPQTSPGNEGRLLGEGVISVLSRWLEEREGSRDRVARLRPRGEHGTLRYIPDGWGRVGKRPVRSVQEAGARKHKSLWARKGFLMLSYR